MREYEYNSFFKSEQAQKLGKQTYFIEVLYIIYILKLPWNKINGLKENFNKELDIIKK